MDFSGARPHSLSGNPFAWLGPRWCLWEESPKLLRGAGSFPLMIYSQTVHLLLRTESIMALKPEFLLLVVSQHTNTSSKTHAENRDAKKFCTDIIWSFQVESVVTSVIYDSITVPWAKPHKQFTPVYPQPVEEMLTNYFDSNLIIILALQL